MFLERLHLASAENLPFPNKSFKASISINTIHNLNLNKCIKALKEMNRLSGKKNCFVQGLLSQSRRKRIFLNWVLTANTHFYPKDWKKIFKKAKYRGDYYWTIV